MRYDLIVFDNDGTLVDTEYPVNQAFLDTIYKYDPAYRIFDVPYILRECFGVPPEGIFERMAQDVATPLSHPLVSQIILEYQEIVPDYLKNHIQPNPEQIELLQALSQSLKVCVASNGKARNVINSLAVAGLESVFQEHNIFTAEQVKNPKPAPDIILHAMDKMGVSDTSRVLHIEDAPRGAQSGLAAGVTVVGFTAFAHNKNLARAKLADVGVTTFFDNWKDFQTFALN